MKQTAAAFAILLAGCTTLPDTDVAAEGSFVAIGEAVRNGDAVLTPLRVGEDSRCPSGVQCVWQGRITLLVEIERSGEDRQAWVTLGQGTLVGEHPMGDNYAFTLEEVRPTKTAEADIAPAEYRFRFGT